MEQHGQLVMIEVVLHISGEKVDVSINGAETFVIYLEKKPWH